MSYLNHDKVTRNMSGVVKGLDKAMQSMDLQKVPKNWCYFINEVWSSLTALYRLPLSLYVNKKFITYQYQCVLPNWYLI